MTRNAILDGYTYHIEGDSGGLFHGDTRFLTELTYALDGNSIERLDTERVSPGEQRIIYASTSETNTLEGSADSKHTDIVIERIQRVDRSNGLTEQLLITNHSRTSYTGELEIGFGTDFADIFDLRDTTSSDRDIQHRRTADAVAYSYSYETHSGEERTIKTNVRVKPKPETLETSTAHLPIDLAPQESTTVRITATITPHSDLGSATSLQYTGIPEHSNHQSVIDQSIADLRALTTQTAHGHVPLAGVPWFMTVFGRDSILTALQTIHIAPDLAEGTVRFLASNQAMETDPERVAEPGRIHHEIRDGERAAKHEVPFYRYYGSIDATPLWITLLGSYSRHHDDTGIVRELREHLDRAVDWLLGKMVDGDDPFIYYSQPQEGVRHQCWKDSTDSLQQADGTSLDPPIAVCEVQGYAYQALKEAAAMYDTVFEDPAKADKLRSTAGELEEAFNEVFWLEETGYYALARGGDGRLADVPASDMGHCLWTGIVPDERAASVVDTLMSDGLSTRYGIRTLGKDTEGYSPVSYHTGSVWPHDTALVALGMERYGYEDEAGDVAGRIMEAAQAFDGRLPEVFCGFQKSAVGYPSSCRPQAWSAAAPLAVAHLLMRE